MNNNPFVYLKNVLYDFEIKNLQKNLKQINAYFSKKLDCADLIVSLSFQDPAFENKDLLINNNRSVKKLLSENFNKLAVAKIKKRPIPIVNPVRLFEYKIYGNQYLIKPYIVERNEFFHLYIETVSLKPVQNSKIEVYKDILTGYIKKVISAYKDKKKIREALLLIESSKILSSTLKLNRLLSQIMNEARRLMGTEGVSLMLKNEKGDLVFHTVTGKKSSKIKSVIIPSGKGIAGWIVDNKKSIIVNDVKKDKRFYKGTDKKTGFKTYNLIGAPLIANDKVIGAIEAVNKKGHLSFSKEDMDVFVALANMSAIAIQNAQYYKELHRLFLSTVKSIVNAIEAKDKYTRGHSERVTKYSIMLAKYLRFDDEFIERIQLAALLHDVGKIGIDESILGKPGKLTDSEYKEIQKHPGIGESIIKPISELKDILPGIRNHHERWDGHGYPDGLKEDEIPLMGRIIALADTYDAMTSDRPYRKGLPHKVAIAEIKKCAGTQFDPSLAKAFINMFRKKELLDDNKIMSII